MQSLINELPGKSQLTSMLDGKFSPDSLGVDGLRDIDAAGMQREISTATSGDIDGGVALPAVPNGLTKEGFMGRVNGPLDKLGGVNRNALVGSISSNPLPISLPQPSFDINTPMSSISSKVIPAKQVSTPTSAPDVPWIDVNSFTDPLSRLADAGASTPMRLIGMLLKIIESFKNTLTDPVQMTKFTTEALAEIYVVQLQTLRRALPLHSINETIGLMQGGYLNQYEQALAVLAKQDIDGFQNLGRSALLPGIQQIKYTDATLQRFAASDPSVLQNALKQVLDFGASDEVFLQTYFDSWTKSTSKVLRSITEPVKDVTAMANDIVKYLEDAAKQAEQAARNVSTTVENSINNVSQLLTDVQTQITSLAGEIEAFLQQVDVGPIVTRIKDGCNKLAAVIEQFFVKVEEIKQKLDAAVAKVQASVDEQLTKTFNALEQQIRQLLGQITAVLTRPDVKDALDKARKGIDDFKNKIGDASLKPVFDLVIEQTTKVEGSVRSLDVGKMGTPQKTALKVGAKVIEAVKVDEIIKPELIEAFRLIREPLQDLIRILRDQVLVIERMIDEFNPGTIATDAILNSGPYQLIMSTLEEFRPSTLLAPLKDVNAQLTKLVAQLDPQIILDELQRLYNRLYDLLDTISPEKLGQLINRAIDSAAEQLTNIRDYDIDGLVNSIKSAISLEKLLASTGLQELADAEFWTLAKQVLGGDFLDEISTAMTTIEDRLRASTSTLNFPSVKAELEKTKAAFRAELVADAKDFAAKAAQLNGLIADSSTQITRLQNRRRELQATYDVATVTGLLLNDLDLAPLTTFGATIKQADALTQTAIRGLYAVVTPVLKAEESRILVLDETILQGVVVAMFKQQFGDPMRKFVADIKVQLQPFKDAIEAIQKVLRTLLALPAQIDTAVGNVLDTLGRAIKQVITDVLKTLATIRKALNSTIEATYAVVKRSVDAFSPYWLLNSFAASDFTTETADTVRGLLAIAGRIRNPGDDRFAALIQTKFTASALALLKKEPAGSLNEANRTNTIAALNEFLRDSTLSTSTTIDTLRQSLSVAIAQIQKLPAGTATGQQMKTLYRYTALQGQLGRAWSIYGAAKTNQNALIRLNRVMLEAAYPDDIAMSLQSLHPFIVEEIAHLYPEETVARLDDIYVKVIEKVKTLPDQLIRRPLDDEFNAIKQLLRKSFDIEGLFNVIDIKLSSLDGDLAQGLDRLSQSYAQLLQTLDERLSG